MAFNMKRPIIKGTPLHKALIAKATEKSIVAPATQGADAALVDAGRAYGKSFIPGAIDYSIDSPELNWKKRKKKEKEKEKEEETPEETPAVEETPTWDNLSEAHADNPDDYRDNKKVTSIPRGYKQPKRKEELKKASGQAPDSGKSTDRFVDAAEEFGYDMSTVKGWEEAEKAMEYNDATDKWINPRVEAGEVKEGGQISEKENLVIQGEIKKASGNYGVTTKDIISDGKGGYVPKEGAVSYEGDTWDAEAGGWRDDATEQYYGPEGQRITQGAYDKLAISQEKKLDKYKRNENIKERNKIKQDARDYYGLDAGADLTQSKLDAYNEMMRKQQEALDYHPEIVEKDDPEPRKIETQKTKDSGSSTPENKSKQKLLDLKYKLAGPSGRANMEADGYIPSKGKSPAEMRDDRIYRNALQDGPVRKNMIKGGYTPE